MAARLPLRMWSTRWLMGWPRLMKTPVPSVKFF